MTPLIEVDELSALLGNDEVRIADVRWKLNDPGYGRQSYEHGHIPGSVFLDLETDLRAAEGPGRHPLPDVSIFKRRLGRLGFGDQHRIVAVDDAGGAIAARLWWMLDDLGHQRVQILNGGLAPWNQAQRPWTKDALTHPPASLASLNDRWTYAVDRDRIHQGGLRLLDARAPERYLGLEEPVDPVPGHIPGAENVPLGLNLGPNGRFLEPAAVARNLEPAGTETRDTCVYCGSGVTACHLAVAHRVAGLPSPLVYEGSWSDWSSAGEAVETGRAPDQVESDQEESTS